MLKKLGRRLHFRLRESFAPRAHGAGLGGMHFVEDYERVVANLVATHPIDEAMALAVGGGDYVTLGAIQRKLLRHAGLADGMSVIDLGCGSGRLAHALGNAMTVRYLGVDVVQALLDYAATRAPPAYRFVRHTRLDIPAEPASADLVCAFSVFTHLLHEESFLYLADMHRVLRPGGVAVFSFLEFAEPSHWTIFDQTVEARRGGTTLTLNTFIERGPIAEWARRLGFEAPRFISGMEAPQGGAPLGQAVAILRRA